MAENLSSLLKRGVILPRDILSEDEAGKLITRDFLREIRREVRAASSLPPYSLPASLGNLNLNPASLSRFRAARDLAAAGSGPNVEIHWNIGLPNL